MRIKIILDAQIIPSDKAGGMQPFISNLVQSLGKLQDGFEDYIVITHWQYPEWLEPYLGNNQRIVQGPKPVEQSKNSVGEQFKRLLGPLRAPVGEMWRWYMGKICRSSPSYQPTIPDLSNFYNAIGGDVVHIPHQSYSRCSLPVIYNPHDLQHIHYPSFFEKNQIVWREMVYGVGCRESKAIIAESNWAKKDIIRNYKIDPKKVFTILRGSPTESLTQLTNDFLKKVKLNLKLPDCFMFYPAQTWPHKNHLHLLEAIKLLWDRDGLYINLVCTGNRNDFWPVLEHAINSMNLKNQVYFLGFISSRELKAVYRLSEFLVFPSLFEGGGFPIVEAFTEGTPVICSNATALPEYGGDAVLLFDPSSPESIAETIKKVYLDDKLKETLRRNGARRIRSLTWERTARTYRALYQKTAGCILNEEDISLLELSQAESCS